MRRPRAVGEAAVNQAVLDLLNRFQYPDNEALAPPFEFGGGGGAPTIVIAAANSTDISKGKADFICPGVNDQEIIQEALDSLTVGGRILFCEGTFSLSFGGSANIVTSGGFSGITFQGMGTEATILNVTDSFGGSALDRFVFECTDADITFAHLSLQGGTGTLGLTNGIALGNHGKVLDCILATDGVGVRLTSGDSTVHATQFFGDDGVEVFGATSVVSDCQFDGVDGIGIYVSGVSQVVLADNHMKTGEEGIYLENGCSRVQIVGNQIWSTLDAIYAESTTHMTITGNGLRADSGRGVNLGDDQVGGVTITGNAFYRCDDGAVQVLGGFDVKVVGNNIFESPFFGATPSIHYDHTGTLADTDYGAQVVANTIDIGNGTAIEIEEYHGSVVADNIIREPQLHGILITNSDRCSVTGNVVEAASQDATNTSDQIQVTGDRNTVQANKLIPLGGAFVPRYGVNVVSGECNMVVGNDLGDPDDYGTDALNDTGANTQLFYPADVIYGDNFTDCGTGS